MAAKKSDLIKTYLGRVGTKDQLYMLLGNTNTTIQANDTNDATITMWKDSEIAYKISRNDTCAVVPNYTWSVSNVYIPWSSTNTNTSKYYVYNKTNGVVYLCLSNNLLNRKDLETKNASTSIPAHQYGVVRYEDGYEWLALYRITPSLLRFVGTNWLPVISIDDFFENDSLSQYDQILDFCSNSPSTSGNCGIYFNQNYSIPATSTTSTAYEEGDLYTTLEGITCKECFMLFQDPDTPFVSKFFGSETPSSTLSIVTKLQKVKNLIDSSSLSSASPYYWLYYASVNGIADGSIVSCFIDLSDFTESQLYVTEANPSLTITTSTGIGASIRLKTFTNSLGEYVIEGIEIVSRGSEYKDIKIEVPSGILKNISSSTLVSSIEINLDAVDGLGIDPITTLDAKHVSTSARISLTELRDSSVSIPDTVNFYGIVKNPKERLGDTTVAAGTTVGQYKSKVSSTVVSITVDSASPPARLSTVDLSNSQDEKYQANDLVVTSDGEIGFVGTKINIKTIDDRGVENFDTATYSGTDYNIIGYDLPDLVFYTGKTETVKKITPLSIGTDTENTKYFNITSIVAI
jgi:hypothetical protein